MNVTCKTCQKPFNKANSQIKKSPNHYCSRTCANSISKRWLNHEPTKCFCSVCNEPRDCRNLNNLCQSCLITNKQNQLKQLTIKDLKEKHKKHLYWYSSEIRNFARAWNKNLIGLPCKNCGYDKHTEICHILGISQAKETTTLEQINNPTNLIVLCPNCHWEFDNGLLKIGAANRT